MNLISRSTTWAYQAASQQVVIAAQSSKQAVVNKVNSTAQSAKQSLASSALGAISYTTGLSNLKSACARMTEPVSYRVVQDQGQAELQAYSPWIHQRVKNAAGEVTIFGGKVLTNVLYVAGAAVTAAEALNLTDPSNTFSYGGISKMVFQGVNASVSAAYKATEALVSNVVVPTVNNMVVPFVTNTALPLVNNVAIPALKAAGGVIVDNKVDVAMGAGVAYLAYKGSHDLGAAFADTKVTKKIVNNKLVFTEEKPMPLMERAKLAGKGCVKLGIAAGLFYSAQLCKSWNNG